MKPNEIRIFPATQGNWLTCYQSASGEHTFALLFGDNDLPIVWQDKTTGQLVRGTGRNEVSLFNASGHQQLVIEAKKALYRLAKETNVRFAVSDIETASIFIHQKIDGAERLVYFTG